MPTKKRRVGFIPRSDVFDLINQLSYESNLSYSKIINILVEEALCNRGLYKLKKDDSKAFVNNKNQIEKKEIKSIINQRFNNTFKNEFLKDEKINLKEVKEEPFDNEIYSKFLMFLQFQERMKKDES